MLAPWFATALASDAIAVCDMVALEILVGESTPARYQARALALSKLPWVAMDARDWMRARSVQAALAAQGGQLHRSVKVPDLLIAATAERAGLVLVHYDQDFDTIAKATGQPARWVAPRGSL